MKHNCGIVDVIHYSARFVFCVQALAYEYAKRGAVLALVSPHKDKLESIADGCRRKGAMDVRVIDADVSKEDDCKKFIEETVNHYGSCMILPDCSIPKEDSGSLILYIISCLRLCLIFVYVVDHLVNNGAISHGALFEEIHDTSTMKNVIVS
jgi:NAD(P)-dependent dehydrogenase (short-subunit alcohol dehydrogenase family)